jgi:hypothetical protein
MVAICDGSEFPKPFIHAGHLSNVTLVANLTTLLNGSNGTNLAPRANTGAPGASWTRSTTMILLLVCFVRVLNWMSRRFFEVKFTVLLL